jgi:hypothetical protein
VLSASRRELFVVANDVQAVDMVSGLRRTIDLGDVTVGPTLHTATYDVVHDRLYVIDEVAVDEHDRDRHRHRDEHRRHEARLLSIDPAGGAQVVARWPRVGATTRFALGAAADALYLASSGEHGRHTLVSIRVEHHPAVWHRPAWDELITRGIGTGEGIVASATTYSSRYAVTFVVERDGHAEVARYEPRRPRFHEGDCMGDVF